jgi:hypothetical protein
MRKLLTHALLAGLIVSALRVPLVAVAAEPSGQTMPAACSVITLDDAKLLIGADAKLDDFSKDDHCSFTAESPNGKNSVLLTVARGSYKRWEDNKTSGEKIPGLGDEAYYERMLVGWVSVIEIRKGDLLFDLTVRDRSSSRDAMKNKEVTFAGKMVSRLAASTH